MRYGDKVTLSRYGRHPVTGVITWISASGETYTVDIGRYIKNPADFINVVPQGPWRIRPYMPNEFDLDEVV